MQILKGNSYLLIALLNFAVIGCSAFDKEHWTGFGAADPNDHDVTASEKMKHTMDQAMGKMTYDEALLNFGPPTNFASGEQIIVASWKRESILGTEFYVSTYGNEMVLSFDKRTKILKAWNFRKW